MTSCDKAGASRTDAETMDGAGEDVSRDAERDSSPDIGPVGTSDTDDDTRVSPDADANDEPVEPPPWLEGGANRCAPTEARISAERLRPPSLPDPLGETPRQAWLTQASSCVQDGKFNGRTYALAHFTVDGEKRPVVVAGVQAHTARTLSDKLVALAFIDAQSGELLRCREFDEPLQTPEPELVVSSNPERYWLYTETIRDVHSLVEEPVYMLQSGTYDEVIFSKRIDDPGSPVIRPNLITPNGQWLTGFDSEYLVSFDALTGQVYWAKHVSELWEDAGSDATLFNAYYKSDTEVFVSINAGNTYGVVSVDECGSAELVTQGHGQSASVREISGFRVIFISRDGNRYYESYKNGVRTHVEECPSAMHYAQHRHSCLHRGIATARFASFELDGGDHHEVDLPSLVEYRYGRYRIGGLAARDGTSLVHRTIRETGEPSGTQSSLLMVDPRSGEIETEFPAPKPREAVSQPLLTSSGMMIFESDGELYGYQTDIPGLATTPNPRGIGVGANENRGWIDVATD